jgi:uncharacterized membrane protein
MDTFLVLYALGGLVLAGLSVPLILQKVPPNGYYGLRVPCADENPELWYQVNAFAGRRFMLAGLGTSVGAIILYFATSSDINSYAFSSLGWFLALFLWAAITSFLYLKGQLVKPEE